MYTVPEPGEGLPPATHVPLRARPTTELLGEVAHKVVELARREIELAQLEVRDDVRHEIQAARVLGFASVCALSALNMVLVAVVLVLARVMVPWAAALVVAACLAVVAALAALWGRARHVRTPMDSTRMTLQENVQWAQQNLH